MSFQRMGRIMNAGSPNDDGAVFAIHQTQKIDKYKNPVMRVQFTMGKNFAEKYNFRKGEYIELFWGEGENEGMIQFIHTEEGPRLREIPKTGRLTYASTRVPANMYRIATTEVAVVSANDAGFIFKIPTEKTFITEPEPEADTQPDTQPEHEGFKRVVLPKKTLTLP